MRILFCENTAQGREEKRGEGRAETPFLQGVCDPALAKDLRKAARSYSRSVIRQFEPLPEPFATLKYASICAGGVFVFIVVAYLSRVLYGEPVIPFFQMYRNAPILLYPATIGAALSLILYAADRVLSARYKRSCGVDREEMRLDELTARVHRELGIPEGTQEVEALGFRYTVEPSSGELHVIKSADLHELMVWRTDGKLMLAKESEREGITVFAFPLTALKGISVFDKSMPLGYWLREESPDAKRFADCGVVSGKAGSVGLRYCCALEVERDFERFMLLFPAYELGKVAALTGLEAPKLPSRRELMKSRAEHGENAGSERSESAKCRILKLLGRETDTALPSESAAMQVLAALIASAVLVLPSVLYILLCADSAGINASIRGIGLLGAFMFGFGLFGLYGMLIKRLFAYKFTFGTLIVGAVLMVLPFVLWI